jgi:hypothetical protein
MQRLTRAQHNTRKLRSAVQVSKGVQLIEEKKEKRTDSETRRRAEHNQTAVHKNALRGC